MRTPNRVFPTSAFELHPSNFATALPGQLFYSTQIPVFSIHPSAFQTYLWFLAENKNADAKRAFRDRRLQTDAGLATRLTTMENKA